MDWLGPVRKWCVLDRFFCNPYHLTSTILARIIVNVTTLAWAVIILVLDDALNVSRSRLAFVAVYVHEDVVASLLLVLCVVHIVCLWRHVPPRIICYNVGYAVLSVAWGFAFFSMVLAAPPVYPLVTVTTAAMALIALYAFFDDEPRIRDASAAS